MKVLAILYNGFEAAKAEPRLLGTVENELGLRQYLESLGHEFIVTSSKEGPDSDFQKHIVDTDILITTPFHPGYLTHDLMNKAKNLKLCVTAGVGSDHIDLNAAVDRQIQVLEVSGSNVVSVAEQVMMSILLLVRNFVPAHEMAARGDWQVSDIARNAFDLEGKVVGTLGAGRIGYRVLQRLVPFNCKELLYYDYNGLPAEAEKAVGARRVMDIEVNTTLFSHETAVSLTPGCDQEFVSQCDVITINAPLHEGTLGLVNKDLLAKFKHGAWLVNTARGAICVAEDVAAAVRSGQLRGYAGDVWNVQPAPRDHPWRSMQGPVGGGNGMTPHYSGTTLDAQTRYAEGTRQILENFFEGKAQDPGNVIVGTGKYETTSYVDRAAIHSLPDIALLEIFDVFRRIQSSNFQLGERKPWYRLVPAHVCGRWRRIILASPKRLRLTIYCGHSTPVAEVLQNSPPFPLEIEYFFGESSNWTPEKLDNVRLSLQHHERVVYIGLYASADILERLLSEIKGDTPHLKALGIQCLGPIPIALPKAFYIGDTLPLRYMYLENVALPSFQHLPNIASFRFDMPFLGSGFLQVSWMERILNALRAMPRIQDLSLDFNLHEFSPSSRSARTTLTQLSSVALSGMAGHIEELMNHFDAPSLSKFTIDIMDTSVPHMPSLPRFINQSAMLKSPLAFVGVTSGCICIKIGDSPVSLGSFVLRAPEVNQHSVEDSVTRIFTALASAFAHVETLVLGFDGDDYTFNQVLDEPAPENWHVILPAMNAVTTLRVDSESSVSLARALCQPIPVKLLPRLRSIRLYFHVSDGTRFNPCDVLMRYQPLTEESRDGENVVDVSCEVLNHDNFNSRHDDLKRQ
ncbi:hypothetical protein BC834DRAFT_974158 [Gloeopeniophorella convolvens]|nr:hypothetical protein BC834DRAFT_974158 [Gloeopeniophorella convolvens]